MWTFVVFENSYLMALESLSYVREQYLASKDIFLNIGWRPYQGLSTHAHTLAIALILIFKKTFCRGLKCLKKKC